MKTTNHNGYRIEPRFSVDGGRTWQLGGFNTTRQTWFPLTPDGLTRAKATADAIVETLEQHDKLAVVINEADEAVGVADIEYSAQFKFS